MRNIFFLFILILLNVSFAKERAHKNTPGELGYEIQTKDNPNYVPAQTLKRVTINPTDLLIQKTEEFRGKYQDPYTIKASVTFTKDYKLNQKCEYSTDTQNPCSNVVEFKFSPKDNRLKNSLERPVNCTITRYFDGKDPQPEETTISADADRPWQGKLYATYNSWTIGIVKSLKNSTIVTASISCDFIKRLGAQYDAQFMQAITKEANIIIKDLHVEEVQIPSKGEKKIKVETIR